MNKYVKVLTIITIFIYSCVGQDSKIKVGGKDTIEVANTLSSKLFLDSSIVERFIGDKKSGEYASRQIRRFYKDRNYQYAWFTASGTTESMRSFWDLHNNYIHIFSDTALRFKPFHNSIDSLIAGEHTKNGSSRLSEQTELQLTKHFLVYINNAYVGRGDPAMMQWRIPKKKLDAVLLLKSFLERNQKELSDWEPVNFLFKRLKKELLRYTEIEKQGGWDRISMGGQKKYEPGDSAFTIKQIKQRLQDVTEFKIFDTRLLYTKELLNNIKSAQRSFGLVEDGKITAALIKELNVPVKDRVRQLLINLERMRWLPEQPAGEFIAVNIPEFRLHVIEGQKKVFSIDIVVGKAAHNTVIFADQLQYVVFSPYWNLPPSIVQDEVLPAIRKNPNYLSDNDMEQTGTTRGLPVIRQKPGTQNALGKVKFMFPNSYNIYFHDTPSKSLFEKENRAFSHGCMRLAEPVKLAEYLLRKQPEWTTEKPIWSRPIRPSSRLCRRATSAWPG